MENKQYSRGKFINECFTAGSMFVGAVIVPDSCNSNNPESTREKKSG